MRYQALFPRLETGVDTDDIIMTTVVNGSYRRIYNRGECTDIGFDQAVNSFDEVERVIRFKSMHLSSDDVLIVIEVEFRDGLVVEDLEKINNRIEKRVKDIIPNARVYLEPEDK